MSIANMVDNNFDKAYIAVINIGSKPSKKPYNKQLPKPKAALMAIT